MRSMTRPTGSTDLQSCRNSGSGGRSPAALRSRLQGSISISAALLFAALTVLILGLLEISRTAGSRYYLQTAADAAVDSLFSEYDRELWDRYRLLVLSCDEAHAREKLEKYAAPYAEEGNWMRMKKPAADIDEMVYITDSGGEYLEQEILDYMKYGIVTELFTSGEAAADLWKDVKEAASLETVTDAYGGCSREAAALEKALMKIASNLESQRELREQGISRLRAGDTGGFHETAGDLRRRCRELDSLVETWRMRADAFSHRLDLVRTLSSGAEEDLGPEGRGLLAGYEEEFRAYADTDSERRQAVEMLPEQMERNLQLLEDAEEKADATETAIEEAIAAAEAEAEAAEETLQDPVTGEYYTVSYDYTDFLDLDEDALWEEAADFFAAYEAPDPGFRCGMAEPEKEGLLEQAKQLLGGGMLRLVIPEGREVPKGSMDMEHLPSRRDLCSREGENRNPAELILICEYAGSFFPDFTDDSGRQLSCELEYLCEGRQSDRENLSAALTEVGAIREGLNYLHILRSSEMRSQADALAASITGSVGLPVLQPLLLCLIIGVWAGAESAADLRDLLAGKKVPLVKTGSEWKMSLENVLQLGREGSLAYEDPGEGRGFDYEAYLKAILLIRDPQDRNYRIMDLIQHNINTGDPAYRMGFSVYSLQAVFSTECRHVFSSLPWSGRVPFSPVYDLTAAAGKHY